MEISPNISSIVACLATLLLAVQLLTSHCADDAFLIVHKHASIEKGKSSSERVTVSISLHNVGSTTAYDVSLNDDTWPIEKFNLVRGNCSDSWDKLEAGKSLTHTFVLEPKEKGLFYGAPAVVKYRVAAKSLLQEAYSTPIRELDLFSERSPDQKYQWVKTLAARYGPLVSVIAIVSIFSYVLIMPSKSKSTKAKKRR